MSKTQSISWTADKGEKNNSFGIPLCQLTKLFSRIRKLDDDDDDDYAVCYKNVVKLVIFIHTQGTSAPLDMLAHENFYRCTRYVRMRLLIISNGSQTDMIVQYPTKPECGLNILNERDRIIIIN